MVLNVFTYDVSTTVAPVVAPKNVVVEAGHNVNVLFHGLIAPVWYGTREEAS